MHVEEFINGLNAGFIKAERYLNDGSPSGFSELNTTSKMTCPRGQFSSFNLQQIKFIENIFIEDIGEYKSDIVKDGCIFIHPDMVNSTELLDKASYCVIDELAVAPTASGRTVLTLKDNHFIKLAYIGYLGRLIRHMNSEIIHSANEVTKQLISATKTNKLNNSFSFLREDFGRVAHIPKKILLPNKIELPFNDKDCYEWGVLFRESKPFPYIDEKEFLIPFFSLFSKEYDPLTGEPTNHQDKPLLVQLYEKQSKSISNFLLNDILFPLFNTYFDALIYAGVELEAHSQNMLLSITEDYSIKRIVCRDLESAGRDVPLMERIGLDFNKYGNYKYNSIKPIEVGQKYQKYYINHSFMFDYKLGEYIVTPLIELAHTYEPFDLKQLQNKIKEFNRQFIEKLPSNFFPDDWCSYENINWELEKKTRVYIWHDNPKYR